jgi:hypothetical protein
MLHLNHKLAIVIAVAGLALPAAAGAADTMLVAQTSQAAAPKATKQPAADPVETRIKQLHDKLHITDAQSAQWNDVAQAMRDNAKAHAQQIDEARKNAKTMTAVDDLNNYAQLAQSHADGVKKLAAAFDTLYGQMSDEQKKTADSVFRQHRQEVMRRMQAMRHSK